MTQSLFDHNGNLTAQGQDAAQNALEVAEALDRLDEANDQVKPDLPYLDPARREFHCSNGRVWKLSAREVNPFVLMQLQTRGKPEVPKVEVTLLGKYKQVQENPNDPAYKAALETWKAESGNRVLQYIFCVGLNTGDIPTDFVEEHLEFMPDAKANEVKYAYIVSETPQGDIDQLIDAIMGEHEPTERGMQQVADSFRGDG